MREDFSALFDVDMEKESDIIVTICGPSGSGKGTLSEFLAEFLGIECYSAGNFFRQIAEEKGMTVEELSDQADRETDMEVDKRTLEKGLTEDCVIESRIAAWVIGDYSDLKIYLTADLEERAKRIKGDLENRGNEEAASNLEQAKKTIKKRDKDNAKRYKEYYGIDMYDTSIFDIVIDNTEMTIKEQNRLMQKAINKHFEELSP